MTERNVVKQIKDLLRQRKAIMLAHNYMRDEIQEIADITGDSLGLSMEAARTDADVIVFCGVYFMAESAAILSPDKTVILPRLDAGCPMADMVTAAELEALKALHPGVPVVTYVNSSADVKACSDICCTSANAIQVVKSLPEQEVIFVPDRNLGRWIARFVPEKRFIFWEGYCPSHERMTLQDVMSKKAQYPQAVFVCHPESSPEVSAVADHVCSTSGMYEWCRASSARQFIIGTEPGILYRLRRDNPGKEFILAAPALVCPNMKLTSLDDVLAALRDMRPTVSVAPEVRRKAKAALDRMLAVPRD